MAEGKIVVLITGANTGLGIEIVKALYKTAQPYEIIVGSRSVEKGEAAVATVQEETPSSPSTLSVLQADLDSDDSIRNALANIDAKFGRLDVLVNNAGGGFDGALRDGELSIRETWQKSWDTNVSGAQVLTTWAVQLLLKSNDPRLLFVTSAASSLAMTENMQGTNTSPAPGWPKPKGLLPLESYRSAKTGLNMMMRQWHRILLNDGVKVWSISPGFLATGLGGVGPEQLQKMGAGDPSIGGNFVKDVIQGARDGDVGKVINAKGYQPW